MQLNIESIGSVESPVSDAETLDAGWGDVVADIVINPNYARGLTGIEDWSHVLVIFVMHEAPFDPAEHLVFRPKQRADMPAVGAFAQRSRYYPNSIGITVVKVLSVASNRLTVRGLDAINGTPVLALKPYAPVFDNVHDPAVPVWFVRLMQGDFD